MNQSRRLEDLMQELANVKEKLERLTNVRNKLDLELEYSVNGVRELGLDPDNLEAEIERLDQETEKITEQIGAEFAQVRNIIDELERQI